MVDSFYDGSSYDQETVRFYDVAYEGAQVRLIGSAVASGALASLEGVTPRSVVVLTQGQLNQTCARMVEALRAPLRQPYVVTSALPGYIGALDMVIVITDNGGDEEALRALITSTQRGAVTVLVGPLDGPLIEEAPRDTIIFPTLPTATSASPARTIASISAVLDLLEEDPRIIADRLDHVADSIDEEIESLSPERDELVNEGRKLRLAAEGHRIVHTGRTEWGNAIANVVAALWNKRGLVCGVLDGAELYESLSQLRGPEADVFYDPFLDGDARMVPFRAVVWAEEEPGIPDAVAQYCDFNGRGPLASTLRLIVRGQSATVYTVEERDV